jgi:hypothetical protein
MDDDPSFLIVDVLVNISDIEISAQRSAERKRMAVVAGAGSGLPVSSSYPIPCLLNLPILPVISAIYVYLVTDVKMA